MRGNSGCAAFDANELRACHVGHAVVLVDAELRAQRRGALGHERLEQVRDDAAELEHVAEDLARAATSGFHGAF